MVKTGRLPAWLMSAFPAAFAVAPLSAGTVSGTIAVSAVVEQSCYLDVRPVRFETLSSDAPRSDTDSSLAVACTPETAFVVGMDEGQHRADGGRRMAAANGEFLSYELYSDVARTRRWGASMTDSVSGRIEGGEPVTLPIYGRIDLAQASAGAYSDVVTVTVSF